MAALQPARNIAAEQAKVSAFRLSYESQAPNAHANATVRCRDFKKL